VTPRTSNPGIQQIDRLISALDVSFIRLTECLVGPGYGLQLGSWPAPGLHYNIQGVGKGYVKGGGVVDLKPHTLVIVPPHTPFRIEVGARDRPDAPVRVVESMSQTVAGRPINRFVACEGQPEIVLICGFFHARYGVSTDLFQSVRAPIVQTFSARDLVESKLREAVKELLDQEVGSGAMSAALLKQVLVTVIRRTLPLVPSWNDQFALLRDEQISRAFAAMAETPGAAHSVDRLAKVAGLSRSAFMQRFVHVVGRPPMEVLRELRMKQAAEYLQSQQTLEEVASRVGYASRSSFIRAFRRVHGVDPSKFRARRRNA
jgi:AraC-like DNA-binding protein